LPARSGLLLLLLRLKCLRHWRRALGHSGRAELEE
jgi:hypothetical protein